VISFFGQTHALFANVVSVAHSSTHLSFGDKNVPPERLKKIGGVTLPRANACAA